MVHRLLLDTSSLMYRAFFALPVTITGTGGRPVNAVRGYLDMTATLVRDLAPDEVLHVFDDDWRPAPRVAAYAGYKAARAPDPEDLPEQFDLLREVLGALGQAVVGAPGWEADDAIGALCAQLAEGDRADIVTGDRDLIQLVRDGRASPDPGEAGASAPAGGGDRVVRVLFTVKGVKGLACYDEAAVQAQYGVPPSRYADFAMLRGDPSDGLPGVKGVGPKTAAALIARHASIEDLLAADGHPPRLAKALRDAADYLGAMRSVVPVRTDVQLVIATGAADPGRVEALAAEHRLDGPLRRLREALAA